MYRSVFRNSIIYPNKYSNLSVSRNYSLICNNTVSQRIKPLSQGSNNENIYLPLLSTYKEKHGQRNFHIQSGLFKDAESKVDKTSQLLKEKIMAVDTKNSADKGVQSSSESNKQIDVPRLTLWERVVKECKHYYHGFKLLFLETKICFRLLKMVLNGHTLTRRERKQFTRTSADLFRLVPFSLFIIIPFMEFTLPIFLKLFPNMLPSTFTEADKEKEALKKQLVAKLEMAKFLQDTLEETAMKGAKTKEVDPLSRNFSQFMSKIRSTAEQPTNEDIIKYSSLFENELTLDNLNRQQLIALCQILEVSTLGNIPPNHILRFQLRMRVRNLEADDRLILNEGIDKLDINELQSACRERGMRAMGLSKDRLTTQLDQWLDLHIKQKIPVSLLLFSRSLYLPENLPKEDLISKTLSALPKSIEDATVVKIAEMSGSKIDNTTKLELLKQEEAQIELENKEHDQEEKKSEEKKEKKVLETQQQVPSMTPEVVVPIEALDLNETIKAETTKTAEKEKAEQVEDTLTPEDIKNISQIIESSKISVKNVISEEISDLKKDVEEYIEDVKEVQELSNKEAGLKETRSAKILGSRVQKLIKEMDTLVEKIEQDKNTKPTVEIMAEPLVALGKNKVSIDELIEAISQIKSMSEEKRKMLYDILQTVDTDNDGNIDDLSDVIKVFDIIEQENVIITKQQLVKIVKIFEKEKVIEEEEEMKKKKEVESTTIATPEKSQ